MVCPPAAAVGWFWADAGGRAPTIGDHTTDHNQAYLYVGVLCGGRGAGSDAVRTISLPRAGLFHSWAGAAWRAGHAAAFPALWVAVASGRCLVPGSTHSCRGDRGLVHLPFFLPIFVTLTTKRRTTFWL